MAQIKFVTKKKEKKHFAALFRFGSEESAQNMIDDSRYSGEVVEIAGGDC